MDYEKKYKEALEIAKRCYKDLNNLDGVVATMSKDFFEEVFPELKESEDEKMREMAIKAVYAPEAQSCIKSWGINPDDVIAWLEKQGEKESDPRYENLEEILAADDIYQMSMNDEMVQEAKEKAVNALSGMCIGRLLGLKKQYVQKPIISNNALREGIAHFGITQYQIDNWLKKYVDVEGNYYDGVLRALRVDELYKLQEKQGKTKPADKVEIKQKPDIEKGKWYVCNTARYTDFVVGKAYYCSKNGMLKPDENEMARYVARNCFRLWTIQDAKDGDVLAGGEQLFLFKRMNTSNSFYAHCNYHFIGYDNLSIYDCSYSIDNIYPATKEQRDLLFKKMHEAGYEWDFEVKKLNKIEKKPACSEEEKQLLLKDLCGRLPYKVRCKCVNGLGGGKTDKGVLKYIGNCNGVISNYYEDIPIDSGFVNNVFYPIENIKPYLRPMASMTDEEFQELRSICPHSMINKTNVTGWFVGINGSDYGRISRVDEISEFIDWLNAHYFDFRGLIEKGLALEAPEGMYNVFQRPDL